MNSLNAHRHNIYSQFGEDGIISEIFSRIGTTTKLAFECGAWNGTHMSNTANLWRNSTWRAILVESEKERAQECLDRLSKDENDRVRVINAKLTPEYGIDEVLKSELSDQGERLDLLSLDIDGNEYQILRSMTHAPRVIVVEFNSTLPPWVPMVGKIDRGVGSSLQAMVEVLDGSQKINLMLYKTGYKLVYTTNVNAFFVNLADVDKFEPYDVVETVRHGHLKLRVMAYDGREMTYGDDIHGGRERGELRVTDFERVG